MKVVYVTRSVVVEEKFAMVVLDEEDLRLQQAVAEVAYKAIPFVAKPQKDKQGKIVLHQMNKDWPPYP
jgi:hypothetical protein